MDLNEQIKWQRSVIRDEWYETMSMMELKESIKKGDELAEKEWQRRWGDDFPKAKLE